LLGTPCFFFGILAAVAPEFAPKRTGTLQLKPWHLNESTAFVKIKKNSGELGLTLGWWGNRYNTAAA
jgi:hypothetical protein